MADEVGVHHVVDAGDGEAECHGHAEGEERLEDGCFFEQVDVLRVFACAVRAVSCGGCGVVGCAVFGRVVFSLVGRHRFLWFWSVSCPARGMKRGPHKKRASVLYRFHVVVGLGV